ncbi:MAG: RteC domain-containing protein [Odoribacter sp.]|nr:RteC domain-containing protein [Odoribacter sp.]
MTHHITIENLVEIASAAVTEELLHEFNRTLQSFCDEEENCTVIFRTLRYTRIRLCTLRKYLPDRNPQIRFLDVAIADITTELDLLQRYGKVHPLPESLHEWNGTLIDYVELIYGLQEVGCIDNGKITVTELASCFNRMFGMTIKESHFYNAYTDMKRRKNDSRTYFIDKMRESLNHRMEQDDLKEIQRK